MTARNSFTSFLESIEKLEREATPGEWYAKDGHIWQGTPDGPCSLIGYKPDDDFIVVARSWIPQALKLLKAYREALEYIGNDLKCTNYCRAKEVLAIEPEEMK